MTDPGEEQNALERLVAQGSDPEVIPSAVMSAYRGGRIKAARSLLMKHTKTERNGVRKEVQLGVLRELRYWVEPAGAPTMYTLNGVGSMLYGGYQSGEDGLHVATLWFTILFVPFFPISAYLVSKAEEGGYYFFGKVPLPPVARFVRGTVGASVLGLIAIGLFGAFMSTTRTDVVAWNGFDVPVDLVIGEDKGTVAPHSEMTFRDVPAEAVQVSATAGAVTIDDFEADFAGTSSDFVLYNVGSRGVHEKLWVRYGHGDPPDGELVSGGPIIVLDDIDYPFVEPPEEKQVEVGSYVDNSMLESLDGDSPALNLVMLLVGEERQADAAALMGSELLVNDDVHEYAWIVPTFAFDGEKEAGRAWLRPILDARPDSFLLHRAWQELHGPAEMDALQVEYRARLAAAPDSADAMYLVARLLDGRDEESIALLEQATVADPGHSRAWGTLGWNHAIQGRYDAAITAYRKQIDADEDSFGQAQVEIVRLTALAGGSVDDQLAVADHGLPEGMPSWLGAHLRIARRPANADQVLAAWADGEEVDPLYAADLMVTGGRFDSARGYIAGATEDSDSGMLTSVPLRMALSDGASDADRAAATAILTDELPGMNEDLQVAAFAFAARHGLDSAAELQSLVANSDFAPLLPAMTEGQPAEEAGQALAGLGLRLQAAGAAALAYGADGADRARWRTWARKVGTADELPFWR